MSIAENGDAGREPAQAIRHVLFVHGFASSAGGVKATYLARQFQSLAAVSFYALDLNPTPADFEFMTVTGMVNRLRQHLLEREPGRVGLIGSSMGALVALHAAVRYGVAGRLLLLAPALRFPYDDPDQKEIIEWRLDGVAPVQHYGFGRLLPLRYDFFEDGQRYLEPPPPAAPTLIIHGRRDDVIPIDESRVYARRHPGVELIEVDSDHGLNDQLPFVWQQVNAFLLA